MDISVIVLTYNQEQTIERTLLSILRQETDAEYEIIIGDDCSTDSTGDICKKFVDLYYPKIKYIRHEKNLGIVKNYYTCFKASSGKFIADCSGDDYWSDIKKMQTQKEILVNRPEVMLVAGKWLTENESLKETFYAQNMALPGEYEGVKILKDLLINRIVVNLSSALYRKELIDDFMKIHPEIFFEGNYMFEDLQIVMTCASKGKIVITDDVVLHYTIGHDSISHPKTFKKKYENTKRAISQFKLLEYFFITNAPKAEKKELKKFFKRKGDYLMAMAFKSGPDFASQIKKDNFKSEMGFKGYVYKLFMLNNFIWKISHKIMGNPAQNH